ncbi:MAG: hypothetical protein CVV27_14825 [Candidatus Melainabacteria bacterium HGW-Melainabacteria-1]|nr:MAG: hypothetical protein CVV27_14825 [Candidatus Melainabacteria bacterium HGW-Melainabacteria-1]
MSKYLIAHELVFFPPRIQKQVKAWQGQAPDRLLLDRSLETPDWSLDQLWDVASHYHINLKLPQSLNFYRRLLEWTAHDPEAQGEILQAIGHVFLLSGRFEDAVGILLRAAKLKAEPSIDYFLCESYGRLGKPKEALQRIERFLSHYTQRDTLLARAYVEMIRNLDQIGDVAATQQRLDEAAKVLNSWAFTLQAKNYMPLLPFVDLPDFPVQASDPQLEAEQFYYEEFNEIYAYRGIWQTEMVKPMLEEFATQLSDRIASLMGTSERPVVSGQRIAIVGDFGQPEASAYLEALIALCRKYSVSLISLGVIPDLLRQEEWLRLIQVGPQLLPLFNAIQSHHPDLLIYLNLGPNNPASYVLASQRLAPVQATLGSLLVTSGLKTLDYFLSFDWLEPDDAEHHYTEHLIRLQGTPAQTSSLPDQFMGRELTRLKNHERYYFCPLPCSSLHRDFLPYLAEILRLDPEGYLFLPGFQSRLDQQLMVWFKQNHPEVSDRIRLLQGMSRMAFLSLCREVNVLLDPMYVGLSYALWQLIPLATPIVTWPSGQARGRMTAGLYRQIKQNESIADTQADYAPLAVALAKDAQAKQRFREHIAHEPRRLFQFQDFRVSLEAFVDSALTQARQ